MWHVSLRGRGKPVWWKGGQVELSSHIGRIHQYRSVCQGGIFFTTWDKMRKYSVLNVKDFLLIWDYNLLYLKLKLWFFYWVLVATAVWVFVFIILHDKIIKKGHAQSFLFQKLWILQQYAPTSPINALHT